jgi:molybdopterin-guanine dinucleotide biosynthesis protein A
LNRQRQADTLHHLGQRRLQARELDLAAEMFVLAVMMRRGFADPDEVATSEHALGIVRAQAGFDAVILAGGTGRRLGGRDKPALKVAGWPLLDHVLLATSAASSRIVVGPSRRSIGEPVFCREQPAGGGPAAGIAAALPRITQPLVALVAADLPFVGAALAPLRSELATGRCEAAVLTDATGRPNYLAALWRSDSLRRVVAEIGPDLTGLPARTLYDRVEMRQVPDIADAGADCDTWDDVAEAERRLTRRNREQLSATPLAWPRLELYPPS